MYRIAGGCFEEGDNLCGNNVVDPGETCDCGPPSRLHSNGTCMADACCFGRNCTLNPDIQCRCVYVCGTRKKSPCEI